MDNLKAFYCNECEEKIPHKFLYKESLLKGYGLIRVFLALITLGISELIFVRKYYMCPICENIIITPLKSSIS